MAYDYEKTKQQYESLNDEQKKQFANMKWWNVQDFLTRYNSEKNQSNNQASTVNTTPVNNTTVTQNKTNNYWVPTEYQASGTNKSNTYQNQWAGNYSYSNQSQYYEKQNTTPEAPKTASSMSSTQKAWDDMSYADQQKKLNEIPWLKEAITKKGWNIKSEEWTPIQTETKWETPNQWWWDYSDNSPERMKQMADNVNWFYQTDPWIFNSEDSYRKFFIDWKGRTPEQEAFLMDLYKNRKIYNDLDNYTADEIWAMDVHGQVPESYLNYLKNSDPERYAAVMDAKAKEQDKIKDKTSLETTNVMTWEWGDTITSNVIEWLKAQWLFVDKDWNFIDDRTENYATDEEKQYAKDAADIIARNLDIDNTVKHTYDDLVEKYGWTASKATLMAMAQDINSDLLREKENNNVELTRLQWYMSYMQQEREDRTSIWQKAIEQLQKQYGMYYTYSPEWMSELAQAQYAATNVTLDQADSWTDTQKQMALQSVLDDYYAKYWDIIQRSEAQVINDVMAYAKKNGVSLSQALEENFLKYLRQKPWYSTLSSGGTINPNVFKVWDDLYWYWDDNWNLITIWWSITWTWTWTMRTERNNNPTAMITEYAKQLWGIEWVDYIQWDSFTSTDANWVTHTYYTAKLLGDPIETTIRLLDRWVENGVKKNVFSAWSYANQLGMTNDKWKNMSKDEKEALILKMLQHEGWDISKMAYYNNWSNWLESSWQLYNPELVTIFKEWRDKPDGANSVTNFWKTYWDTVEAAWVSRNDFLNQYDNWYEEETADAYLDILTHLDQLIELTWWEYDTWERWNSVWGLWDVWAAYDYIKNNLTVNGLRDAKAQWLKLWVLSDSDVKMIWNAATTLKWHQSQGSWNKELQAFREKLLWKNKYLRQKYQNTSAYSPNTTISFNNNDRKFTIWKTTVQKAKGKTIKSLWK